MKLTIHFQDEPVPSTFHLDPGWNYLRYSLGVWVFNEDEALLTNGCATAADIGAVFIKRLVAEGAAGLVVLADTGEHVLHPRCLLPIRTKGYAAYRRLEPRVTAHLPRERMEWSEQYHAVGETMLAAWQTGEPAPAVNIYGYRNGPWMPLDENNPGAPGGYGLEPLPGWERSSLYRILGCDLALHRMAIASVHAFDGTPFTPSLAPGEYHLARGWSKTTQLQAWCEPGGVMTDDRYPKSANVGFCGYFNQITGINRWGGWLPYDGQHLVRGIRHAQAARDVWCDPIAKKALELIAHDALLAWGHLSAVVSGGSRHQGAAWAGRELGWVLHAANLVGREEASTITRALACVEMQSGFHQRCPFGPPWGFAPDPWADYGMPTTVDAAQSIEASILAWGLGWKDAGQSKRILGGLLAYDRPPKAWMGVAPANLPAFPKSGITHYGGPETFNIWYAVGRAMESDPKNRQYQRYALMVPPPGEAKPKNSIPGLYQALCANPYVTHTATVIRELETLIG